MLAIDTLKDLSDTDLVARLRALVRAKNDVTAELIAHLGEVDKRRLFVDYACPSMFAYCVSVLNLSESAAYKHIRAARAARDYPVLLELLSSGRLHLCGLVVLAPKLTAANHIELAEAACGKTKSEIAELLADRNPKPDVADRIVARPQPRANPEETPSPPTSASVLGLFTDLAPPLATEEDRPQTSPVPTAQPTSPTPPTPPAPSTRKPPPIDPLGGQRYKVEFTANKALVEKLHHAQALLSHRQPNADIAAVIDQALTLLNERLLKERFAVRSEKRDDVSTGQSGCLPKTTGISEPAPEAGKRPASRHIPNAVKRQVVARDGLQCTFVDANGNRCQETRFLELHHEKPWGKGGKHTVDNIRLRCRAHNSHAARADYGADTIDARIADRRETRKGVDAAAKNRCRSG